MTTPLTDLPTIQHLRQQSRLTQSQLAHRAGVSQTTIANWEQNRASPSLDQLRRVCAVLGVSVRGVALSPYERLLHTHGLIYRLRAQHATDHNLWIGRCVEVDFGDLPLTDPTNPFSQGMLLHPMDESDLDTTSVVVPVTWKWEETGPTADEALRRLADRIIQALDRCAPEWANKQALRSTPR